MADEKLTSTTISNMVNNDTVITIPPAAQAIQLDQIQTAEREDSVADQAQVIVTYNRTLKKQYRSNRNERDSCCDANCMDCLDCSDCGDCDCDCDCD